MFRDSESRQSYLVGCRFVDVPPYLGAQPKSRNISGAEFALSAEAEGGLRSGGVRVGRPAQEAKYQPGRNTGFCGLRAQPRKQALDKYRGNIVLVIWL